MQQGFYQFIFVSPERLQIQEFRDYLQIYEWNELLHIALLNEAHCVSEWDMIFEPAYLR
jgi:ATP-dependent DNA helicase RecQ